MSGLQGAAWLHYYLGPMDDISALAIFEQCSTHCLVWQEIFKDEKSQKAGRPAPVQCQAGSGVSLQSPGTPVPQAEQYLGKVAV
jgi:hypothetical protein